MMRTPTIDLLAGVLAVCAAMPTLAAEMNEDQAKSRMEAAGYADVTRLHEANMGEWMADATKDGHPVMIVLDPDGKVSPRQQVDVPPAATAPAAPATPSEPAK